jgi:2-oxoglutarate ferredoxin oxidoreductase subunit delta
MVKGEVIIDEALCKGCGLCIDFCPEKCFAISERLSHRGLPLAEIVLPEKCNACGVCGWMCPEFAVEVYKYVNASSSS